MPRAARFKIAAIAELHRQLAYAPAETRVRQMDAAERLIADIDPQRTYPHEFVVYRITGYRPDQADDSAMLVGEALLTDLVNLVQSLSAGLELRPEHGGRQAVDLDSLRERLAISSKTIQRYRRRGLVCHYITGADRIKRLACFEDALARFVSSHRDQLERASEYTRIGPAGEQAMIEQARQLRLAEGVSLNEAARRIALESGRAHETVRLVLQRHDRRASQPIFSDRKPLSPRQVRLVHRAWQWGVEPAQLAVRLGKTRAAIHRAINRRRRELLRTLDFSIIAFPTFDMPEAESIILAGAASSTQPPFPSHADTLQWVQWILEHEREADDAGDALLAAYNFLKMRAQRGIGMLREWPQSDSLDAIETDLRWAAQLRVRLAALAAPAALRRIEQHERRQLSQLPAEKMAAHLRAAIDVVAGVVEIIDPAKGQRLDRLAAFAMERSLATAHPSQWQRASARHAAGSLAVADPFAPLRSWVQWLELSPHHQAVVAGLPADLASLMELRYGLHGRTPSTVKTLANQLGQSTSRIVRRLRKARMALRTAAIARMMNR